MPAPTVDIVYETNILGQRFRQVRSIEGDSAVIVSPNENVAALKAGTLTTRTDNTTGILTMESGHGIITGDKIDIFWGSDGSTARVNVTVGTVASLSVPFSLGAGDNLPVATTVVKAGLPTSKAVSLDDATLKALCAKADVGGRVTLFNGSTLVATLVLKTDNGNVAIWDVDNGATNPLGSSDVTAVKFSHAQTTAKPMTAVALSG